MPTDLPASWSRIDAELRRAVPERTYRRWLAPLRPRGREGDALVLTAPHDKRGEVADRFGRVLQACAASVLGPDVTVEVVSDRETPDAGVPAPQGRRDAGLNPKYSFEQFVIGDGNRLAHGAALAVAEMPAQAYNPLFVYGPPGVGKTHLLHSIGNYVTAYGGGLTVRYATVDAFTTAFVEALRGGSVERFKTQYRSCDVLLVDDIQFLEKKAKTEEEFFHTFNALYETGAQLVLTSDRLPRDMAALEDRLRKRFEAGLVTDIAPPDRTTRLTILRKRILHDGLAIADPEVPELIADRVADSVRTLEGALIRVVAYASLTGRPLDADLAAEVLDGLYPGAGAKPCSIREIQTATCDAFGVSRDELLSHSRAARVAWPRQVAMYLSRELTDRSLPAIGKAFGDRNHTTVMHAVQRTGERMAADKDAFEAVRSLTERLGGDREC